MILVFDTNIIHEDFYLQGSRISRLCSAAEKLGYELMVPEVVVDEMLNQYRKRILQNIPGYASVLRMVARTQGIVDKFDKEVFVDERVREYETFLKKRLSDIKIDIIAYPKVDARTLVLKQLGAKKPFREMKDGIVGTCDAVIWESVKTVCRPSDALIEDPQVELLTNNIKDFAGPDKNLHPDLVLELKNAGFAENCVALIPDIDCYFKDRIDPELEELEKIKRVLLKDGKFNRFDVAQESARVLNQDFIAEVLNDLDFDSGQRFYLPNYVEDPTINNVNDPVIKDITVRRLSDQSVLIEVQAIVSVDLDFFVENSNYFTLDEDHLPDILDSTWNDYYMWCEGSADVSASLAFRTTPKLGKILSEDVQVTGVVM